MILIAYLRCLVISYTGSVVLELDFDRIDINQCPRGRGNDGKNYFADTARCKKETTEVYHTIKTLIVTMFASFLFGRI